MRKLFVLFALLLAVSPLGAASGGQLPTPTEAWNMYAGQYGFESYPTNAMDSFAESYYGSDFAGDFAAIKHAITAETQRSNPPVWGGDDVLNGSLESW